MARSAILKPKKVLKHGQVRWLVNVPESLSETGRYQRLYFATREQAVLEYERLKVRKDNFGRSRNLVAPAQLVEAAHCYQLLAEHPELTLKAVVEGYLKTYQATKASIQFLDLFNDYVALKERDPEYVKELEWIRDRYPELHSKLACDITGAELEALLRPLTAGARNPIQRYWRAVFNYGKKKKYLTENPVSSLEFTTSPREEVEIIPTHFVEKMLNHALSEDLELLPFLILGLFCGIRPDGELQQILWDDVHWMDSDPKVVVRAKVSKTRRRRFPDLSPNAIAWIRAYQLKGGNMTGPIVTYEESPLRKHRTANWKAAGMTRWVQQYMRHTFCSNWLALHKDVNKLVLISGHDSVDTMWRNYYKGTTEAAAKEFWSIMPLSEPANVISFVRAAESDARS